MSQLTGDDIYDAIYEFEGVLYGCIRNVKSRILSMLEGELFSDEEELRCIIEYIREEMDEARRVCELMERIGHVS